MVPKSSKIERNNDTTTAEAEKSRGNLPVHSAFKIIRHYFEVQCPSDCVEVLSTFNVSAAFDMIFAACIGHFPQYLGFLFAKDEDGVTTFDLAVERIGFKGVLSITQLHITQEMHLPILHKVLQFVPQHFNVFCRCYPDGIYERNVQGRLLLHTALSHGLQLSGGLLLTINAPEEAVSEIDPVTGLLPFMMAAVGEDSDLTTIYFVLTRKPKVLIDATFLSN